jgi:hypothetical protein
MGVVLDGLVQGAEWDCRGVPALIWFASPLAKKGSVQHEIHGAAGDMGLECQG